ncbi:DnaB-like helicase N-terminal domain-containing protein [Streptomyces sp. NPDC020192]|uniref:DnaB-like helicase N-terminal domain-containing protein n=1 Tax=Streptomyces sp. NPDC020192 TaxID=3365066 RepID=UPI00379F2EDB
MPRTPDPDEDDLYTRPPHPPVYYAEQALLGALLLDPQLMAGVTGIAPEAFSTAVHSALFAAIRCRPAPDPAEHAKNTTWLNEVLAAAHAQARGLTASYLHHLVQVCPRPQHAPAYARIVEAEHARRRLRAAAAHLAHTARDTSLPNPVPTALGEADALASVVDEIAAAFPPHSGSLPRAPALPPAATLDDAEAADEERLLLATATAHPGDVEQMRWLSSTDFTLPLHAGLWQCVTGLVRRRAPVDPVTVLWEAGQCGLLDAGPEPRELLGFLSQAAGSPEHWGERILNRSVLATAHHTGLLIHAFTGEPANTPYQLVVGSRRALADLTAVRTRWHHATSPVPAPAATPARAKAAAAPRAGPPKTTAPTPARISR